MLAVIKGMTPSLRGQSQLFMLQALPLPRNAALLFLLRAGHPYHTECFMIPAHVTVQRQRQLLSISFVGLNFLAILIPVLGSHNVIGGPQLLEFAMQTVTERPGLITGEYFFGQCELL